MNTLKYLLLISVTAFISSCSSDAEDANKIIETDNLSGTWTLTEYNYSADQVVVTNSVSITVDTDGIGQNLDYSVTFGNNPDVFSAEGMFDIELTTDAGDTIDTEVVSSDFFLISVFKPTDEDDTITWEIKEDILNLTLNNQLSEVEILELSENKLELKFEIVEKTNTATVSGTFTIIEILTFEK